LVNKDTKLTTALYCHNFGSFDVIGHVTSRPTVGGFLWVAHWHHQTRGFVCVCLLFCCILCCLLYLGFFVTF